MNIKKFLIKNANVLLISVFMLTTQLHLNVFNPLSKNSTVFLISDIFLFIIFIYLINLYFFKKDKILFKENKNATIILFILCSFFLLAIPLRLYFYNKLIISISMIKTIIYGYLLYLITRHKKIPLDDIVKSLVVVYLVLNSYIFMNLFFNDVLVRESDVLGNINIYLGFVLFTIIPMLHYMLHKNRTYKYISSFIMFTTCLILFFSGSRVAIYIYIFLIFIYILIFCKDFNLKNKIILIFSIVVALISCSVYSILNDNDELLRVFYYPAKVIEVIFDVDFSFMTDDLVGYSNLGDNISESDLGTEDDKLIASDPDRDYLSNEGVSLHRVRIYEKFSDVFSKYWIIGTGRHAIYFTEWGYQSPHNILFESLLCFGVVGSIPYLYLAFFPMINLYKFKKNSIFNSFSLGFIGILLYSMLQPMMSDKVIIVALIWMLAGGIINDETK